MRQAGRAGSPETVGLGRRDKGQCLVPRAAGELQGTVQSSRSKDGHTQRIENRLENEGSVTEGSKTEPRSLGE